jgi:N-acetylglucosaminyldiphosphoundecaprenol N-acetyl-beta-D-mannosaminyltransferase
VLEEIDHNIRGRRDNRYIAITNSESMYLAKKRPVHARYIHNAHLSLCDGIGVVIAGRFAGERIARLTGPDLLTHCCQYGVDRKWRHYFCGGKPGVADLLRRKLEEEFPGMVTAGTCCPPFRRMSKGEDDMMIRAINAAKPDVLWVGLGLPKQEAWIAEHLERLEVPWAIGVGAAFDFLSGTVRRAPKMVRDVGMEWCYRLCREPRMFMRNVRSGMFVLDALFCGLKRGR